MLYGALLSGCGGIGVAYQKILIGPYALMAVDEMQQMSLDKLDSHGNGTGIVTQTVFGAGWTNDWIIVEQHPGQFGRPLDKNKTNFYIFRVSDGVLKGPFTKEEFEKARSALGVPGELAFTLVFDELK